MTVRFLARGHETFDVYDGLNLRGSVWLYPREGWAALNPQLWLVSGFHETREAAAEVLVRRVTSGATGVERLRRDDEARKP